MLRGRNEEQQFAHFTLIATSVTNASSVFILIKKEDEYISYGK